MRILNHDFAGHPFQAELSRTLARRGHEVIHAYCARLTTGVGTLRRLNDDPVGVTFLPVDLGRTFARHSLLHRPRDELAYGRALARSLDSVSPDVVLSGNTPVSVQALLGRECRERSLRFVFWLQDALSIGTRQQLEARLGWLGRMLALPLSALERRSVKRADHVVAITDAFLPLLSDWGVPPHRATVIENWAPRNEVKPKDRDNSWALEHGLHGKGLILLYSGTLGLKHDPEMLASLAERVPTDTRVVVVSEGSGAEYLGRECRTRGIDNLILLPFQPYERLGEVLSSADVLLALLEPEAAGFSVPSKILTYHCVARPIVAAMPAENLAATILQREGSGVVTPPGDRDAFAAAAMRLGEDPHRRVRMGTAAREYADRAFDVEAIADRFEIVLGC